MGYNFVLPREKKKKNTLFCQMKTCGVGGDRWCQTLLGNVLCNLDHWFDSHISLVLSTRKSAISNVNDFSERVCGTHLKQSHYFRKKVRLVSIFLWLIETTVKKTWREIQIMVAHLPGIGRKVGAHLKQFLLSNVWTRLFFFFFT